MSAKDVNTRFDEKVEAIPFSECELWSGGRRGDYGGFKVGGRSVLAHRFQWERHNGPIPEGLMVLHTCNNGHLGCVSIDHLYLGTHKDNMRDMKAAGSARGSNNARAILSEEAAVNIIRRLRAGESQSSIAKDYAVGRMVVHSIAMRKTWRHLYDNEAGRKI